MDQPQSTPLRKRTQWSSFQLVKLEQEFLNSKYPCSGTRTRLAQELSISEKQIKVWFQNRRMKYKKESKTYKSYSCELHPPPSASIGLESGSLPTNAERLNITQRLLNHSVVAQGQYSLPSTAGSAFHAPTPWSSNMYESVPQAHHQPPAYGDQLGLEAYYPLQSSYIPMLPSYANEMAPLQTGFQGTKSEAF